MASKLRGTKEERAAYRQKVINEAPNSSWFNGKRSSDLTDAIEDEFMIQSNGKTFNEMFKESSSDLGVSTYNKNNSKSDMIKAYNGWKNSSPKDKAVTAVKSGFASANIPRNAIGAIPANIQAGDNALGKSFSSYDYEPRSDPEALVASMYGDTTSTSFPERMVRNMYGETPEATVRPERIARALYGDTPVETSRADNNAVRDANQKFVDTPIVDPFNNDPINRNTFAFSKNLAKDNSIMGPIMKSMFPAGTAAGDQVRQELRDDAEFNNYDFSNAFLPEALGGTQNFNISRDGTPALVDGGSGKVYNPDGSGLSPTLSSFVKGELGSVDSMTPGNISPEAIDNYMESIKNAPPVVNSVDSTSVVGSNVAPNVVAPVQAAVTKAAAKDPDITFNQKTGKPKVKANAPKNSPAKQKIAKAKAPVRTAVIPAINAGVPNTIPPAAGLRSTPLAYGRGMTNANRLDFLNNPDDYNQRVDDSRNYVSQAQLQADSGSLF